MIVELISSHHPNLHCVNAPKMVWDHRPDLEVWFLHSKAHRYYGPASKGHYLYVSSGIESWYMHGEKIK